MADILYRDKSKIILFLCLVCSTLYVCASGNHNNNGMMTIDLDIDSPSNGRIHLNDADGDDNDDVDDPGNDDEDDDDADADDNDRSLAMAKIRKKLKDRIMFYKNARRVTSTTAKTTTVHQRHTKLSKPTTTKLTTENSSGDTQTTVANSTKTARSVTTPAPKTFQKIKNKLSAMFKSGSSTTTTEPPTATSTSSPPRASRAYSSPPRASNAYPKVWINVPSRYRKDVDNMMVDNDSNQNLNVPTPPVHDPRLTKTQNNQQLPAETKLEDSKNRLQPATESPPTVPPADKHIYSDPLSEPMSNINEGKRPVLSMQDRANILRIKASVDAIESELQHLNLAERALNPLARKPELPQGAHAPEQSSTGASSSGTGQPTQSQTIQSNATTNVPNIPRETSPPATFGTITTPAPLPNAYKGFSPNIPSRTTIRPNTMSTTKKTKSKRTMYIRSIPSQRDVIKEDNELQNTHNTQKWTKVNNAENDVDDPVKQLVQSTVTSSSTTASTTSDAAAPVNVGTHARKPVHHHKHHKVSTTQAKKHHKGTDASINRVIRMVAKISKKLRNISSKFEKQVSGIRAQNTDNYNMESTDIKTMGDKVSELQNSIKSLSGPTTIQAPVQNSSSTISMEWLIRNITSLKMRIQGISATIHKDFSQLNGQLVNNINDVRKLDNKVDQETVDIKTIKDKLYAMPIKLTEQLDSILRAESKEKISEQALKSKITEMLAEFKNANKDMELKLMLLQAKKDKTSPVPATTFTTTTSTLKTPTAAKVNNELQSRMNNTQVLTNILKTIKENPSETPEQRNAEITNIVKKLEIIPSDAPALAKIIEHEIIEKSQSKQHELAVNNVHVPPKLAANNVRIPPELTSNNVRVPPELASNNVRVPPELASNNVRVTPELAKHIIPVVPELAKMNLTIHPELAKAITPIASELTEKYVPISPTLTEKNITISPKLPETNQHVSTQLDQNHNTVSTDLLTGKVQNSTGTKPINITNQLQGTATTNKSTIKESGVGTSLNEPVIPIQITLHTLQNEPTLGTAATNGMFNTGVPTKPHASYTHSQAETSIVSTPSTPIMTTVIGASPVILDINNVTGSPTNPATTHYVAALSTDMDKSNLNNNVFVTVGGIIQPQQSHSTTELTTTTKIPWTTRVLPHTARRHRHRHHHHRRTTTNIPIVTVGDIIQPQQSHSTTEPTTTTKIPWTTRVLPHTARRHRHRHHHHRRTTTNIPIVTVGDIIQPQQSHSTTEPTTTTKIPWTPRVRPHTARRHRINHRRHHHKRKQCFNHWCHHHRRTTTNIPIVTVGDIIQPQQSHSTTEPTTTTKIPWTPRVRPHTARRHRHRHRHRRTTTNMPIKKEASKKRSVVGVNNSHPPVTTTTDKTRADINIAPVLSHIEIKTVTPSLSVTGMPIHQHTDHHGHTTPANHNPSVNVDLKAPKAKRADKDDITAKLNEILDAYDDDYDLI